MLRRKRDRLGVSFAKQKMMRRFLDRLRRFGPQPPASVWAPPRSKHILTALKDISRHMGNAFSKFTNPEPSSSPLASFSEPRSSRVTRARVVRCGFPAADSPGFFEPICLIFFAPYTFGPGSGCLGFGLSLSTRTIGNGLGA